jgi:hypothetical protein
MISRSPSTDLAPVTYAAEQLQPLNQRSGIATAAMLGPTDTLWDNYRFTSLGWQREAWRFYHIIPELHYAANYIGAACSRVRIFIEHLNEYGVPDGEVTNATEISSIADTLFGGSAARAQALRSIAINQTIAGECYAVGRARRGYATDKWYIASTTELKRRNGGYVINFGWGNETLLKGTDLVVRLWTPDEEYHFRADSPTQPCLPVLQELEELMMYEFSQIDSRAVAAGMIFLPAEMSNGPSDASTSPQSADDVFNQVALAAKASRSGRGVAAGVVPQFLEIPGEYIGKMQDQPLKFASELSDRMKEYKESAIRRLATGLNMPAEILLGMGDVNHISVWSIEESFVKIQVEPMMSLICDGLTTAYLRPLLDSLGKDPARYRIGFDTAPLTVRASRLQDTLNLYERRIVNKEAVLLAGDYNPLTDAMNDEESTELFIRELMLRDPTLIAVEPLREAANLDIDMPEPVMAVPGEVPGDPNAPGAAPPPAPARSTDNQRRPVDPRSTDTGPTRPAANQGTPILASSVLTTSPEAVLAAANVAARRALEIAGGRLLTRQIRGQFPDVAKHEIHTRLKVTNGQVSEILAGAFDHVSLDFAGLGVDSFRMARDLTEYCQDRLLSGKSHDIEKLAFYVRN